MASLRLMRQLFLISATITLLTCLVCVYGVNHPVAKSIAFVTAAASLLGFFEFWKHDLSLLGTYAMILMVLFTGELVFCIVAIIKVPEARHNKKYFWTCWLLIPLLALLIVLLVMTKRLYLTHSVPSDESNQFLFAGKQSTGHSSHQTEYGSQRNVYRGHWTYQDKPLAQDPNQFIATGPPKTGKANEQEAEEEETPSTRILIEERPDLRSGDDWSNPLPTLTSPTR